MIKSYKNLTKCVFVRYNSSMIIDDGSLLSISASDLDAHRLRQEVVRVTSNESRVTYYSVCSPVPSELSDSVVPESSEPVVSESFDTQMPSFMVNLGLQTQVLFGFLV